MKTQVTDTSVRAYHAMTYADLTRGQRKVVDAMKPGRIYTRRELEPLTKMRSGPVCGRVNELLAKDPPVLEVVGEKLCPESGKQVEALKLAAAQLELLA